MAQQSFASSSSPSARTIPGALPTDLPVVVFEPDLLKMLRTSKTPIAVANTLLSRAHRFLQMDVCLLVVTSLHHSSPTTLMWRPGEDLQPVPLFPLTQAILERLEALPFPGLGEPLAISDMQEWLGPERHSLQWGNPPQTDAANPAQSQNLETCPSALISRAHYQGKTSGTLIVLRSQSHPWTEMDMQVCHTLATQIAIALSQGHLQNQIEQQLQQQSLIYRLVEVIREGWDLERIFELAVDGLVNLLQVSRGMVLSFKYADPQLKGRPLDGIPRTRATVDYLYSSIHLPPPEETGLSTWLNHSFQISDCAIGRQIISAVESPVVIPPVGACPEDYSGNYGEFIQTVSPLLDLRLMPALLVMPLEHQGIGLGCLILQQQQYRSWHPDELALVRLVATHISTAMIQAKTLRKVQALVDERTAQLRHSLDVQAKLYEKTRQQVEQLQRMNQVMEEFLSTVSHELLTPLTSMKMAIRMLREAPLTTEQRDRYLSILDRQCTQETHLIRDLLTIQKIESQNTELQLHQVDLQYLIRDLQQSWEEPLTTQGLTFQTHLPERPILMRTDPESLHRILNELMANAQKYSQRESTIRMQVVVESSNTVPQVTLSLWNTGIGIMPDELSMIFEKFRRGREAIHQAIPGIGLGLALARGLAAHLSGAIAATSTPIPNSKAWETCFILTLPLSPELV
ncbi:GAF domain-containing protein [Leptolyngbya sp. FACHB-16]|nr:GAF domain-containing protein [Leptolyngbya sp. FACHB-16]MBD1910331.1 GAF domain-containing protein [Leptolyngbya sp. FACHB-8]MBD2154866.1 GAF domain-containing protein [Leptolyngbya sp. FACHB-16]